MIATTQGDHGFLAADRMWSTASNPDVPLETGEHRKVFVHSRFPLAVATMGLTMIFNPDADPKNPFIPISKVVSRFFGSIKSPNDIGADAFRAMAERSLLVGVRRLRSSADDAAWRDVQWVVLAFTYYARSGVQITVVYVHDEITVEPHEAFLYSPPTLNAHYNIGDRECYAGWIGESLPAGMNLSGHLKRSIESGIAEDARQHGGSNRYCGGTVDVVRIDKQGARLVLDRSIPSSPATSGRRGSTPPHRPKR